MLPLSSVSFCAERLQRLVALLCSTFVFDSRWLGNGLHLGCLPLPCLAMREGRKGGLEQIGARRRLELLLAIVSQGILHSRILYQSLLSQLTLPS